jgi:hypothetical protein
MSLTVSQSMVTTAGAAQRGLAGIRVGAPKNQTEGARKIEILVPEIGLAKKT